MSSAAPDLPAPELLDVELARIAFDPDQPRTKADETLLDQLVRSVRIRGLEQPVVVTPHPDPEIAVHKPYLLLHGSRRCTAALRAGLSAVSAVVRHEEMAPDDRLMRQLAENDEREDLNVHDRAVAVARALDVSGLSHAEFAKKHGKSRPWVSSQLWLARVEGLTATALRERHVRHGETARLFDQLPERTQQRLIENARASGEPITLALVKRFGPRPKDDAAEPDARQGFAPGEPDEPDPESAAGQGPPDDAASPPPPTGGPPGFVPVYLRTESVPTLLGHFGIGTAAAPHAPGPPHEAAALLAAYLESLAQPPSAAVQT